MSRTSISPLAFLATALFLFAAPASAQNVSVTGPSVACAAGTSVTAPITVGDLTGRGIIAYEFTLQFDSAVAVVTGIDKANTLSSALTVVGNPKATEIILSAAGSQALSGSGTLLNLNIDCVANGTAALTWSRFVFNEGDPAATTANGSVNVGGAVEINLEVSPDVIDFGVQTVGEPLSATVTITNPEDSQGTLTGDVSLTGSGASAFTITSGGGALSLAAGASKAVEVSFQPSAAGNFIAQLQITHNATGVSSPFLVQLAGSAEMPPASIGVAVSPSSLSFGEVLVGASEELTLTVSNPDTSNSPLVGTLAVAGAGFTISAGDAAFTIAPGASHEAGIVFSPTAGGTQSGTVTVSHNGTLDPTEISVEVSGVGVSPEPTVTIEVEALDLGDVIVAREGTATVTVQNTGTAALSGSTEITGADADDFAVVGGSGDFMIEAGGSLDIEVTFSPETAGDKTAELRISHNAQNVSSPLVVTLSGVAVMNTSAEAPGELPRSYQLAQNFPNPFNPQTTLTFGLPERGHVRVSVYDLSGRELSVLVHGVLSAGWHTVRFDATSYPSGTYLYRMAAEGQTLTRKMTVLK